MCVVVIGLLWAADIYIYIESMKTQKLVSWLMYIKSNSNTLMNLKDRKSVV